MFNQNAAVHHHFEARSAGARGRSLIYNPELHPDHTGFAANRRLDNLRNEFRTGSPGN